MVVPALTGKLKYFASGTQTGIGTAVEMAGGHWVFVAVAVSEKETTVRSVAGTEAEIETRG